MIIIVVSGAVLYTSCQECKPEEVVFTFCFTNRVPTLGLIYQAVYKWGCVSKLVLPGFTQEIGIHVMFQFDIQNLRNLVRKHP